MAIFPAGTEVGLEINNALKYSTHFTIYGFTSIKDHSEYVYTNYISGLPYYSDSTFTECLNHTIDLYGIDYIYPAHDDVLLFLTLNQEKIKAKIITSDKETVRICRSKTDTYRYFQNDDFIPVLYNDVERINYPVFAKPNVGQGSIGAKLIRNRYELDFALYENPNIVISEYLPGKECTVDCFTDYEGVLRVCIPRLRNRIKSGISANAQTIALTEDIRRIANTINQKLKFNGAWFFQIKQDSNGIYKLLEISPRIAGTMGLTRNQGINLALLTLFNTMKIPFTIINNHFDVEVDRALISRYKVNIQYDTVYLDFDDTLVINGKVNTQLIMFLYQLRNQSKKIIMLTKHDKDIRKTLCSYHIDFGLFQEIIHLKRDEEKYRYITKKNSIYIDDSFSEREAIYRNLGIPVFDVSEIESLIDWRV